MKTTNNGKVKPNFKIRNTKKGLVLYKRIGNKYIKQLWK